MRRGCRRKFGVANGQTKMLGSWVVVGGRGVGVRGGWEIRANGNDKWRGEIVENWVEKNFN